MKNVVKISSTIIFGTLLFGFAQTSQAAAFVTTLPTPEFHTTHARYFISPSVSYSTIDTSNFSYGVTDLAGAQNAMTFNTKAYGVVPGITLGVNFDNSFLPIIFGPRATIEGQFSYLNTKRTSNLPTAPSGFYWAIDGSGSIVPFAVLPVPNQVFTAQNTQFTAKNTLTTSGVFFVGHGSSGNTNDVQFISNPYIGVIYHNLKQSDSLNTTLAYINPPPFPIVVPYPMQLNENLKTNYYGAEIGNTFALQFNPHFATFIKGDVALVHANSSLSANQSVTVIASTTPTVIKSVTDAKNKWAFEAGIGAGVNIYPFKFPFEITLEGGANYMGFVPKIINPTANNDASSASLVTTTTAPAQIGSSSALNPYGTLTLTLPF